MTLNNSLRHLAIGTLTGAFSGAIAGGVGSRLAMRITALMTDARLQGRLTEAQARVGEITPGGTFFLITFSMAFGIYCGLLYRAIASGSAGKPWLKGLLFGVFLLLLHGSTFIEGDNFDFQRFGSAGVNVAMFSALPLLLGIIAAYADTWLERKYPAFAFKPRLVLLYIPAAFGLLTVILLVIAAITSLVPDPQKTQLTSVEQGWLIVIMAIMIAVSLVFEPTIKRLRYGALVRMAAFSAPAFYGGALLYSAISEIMG